MLLLSGYETSRFGKASEENSSGKEKGRERKRKEERARDDRSVGHGEVKSEK